MMREHKPFEPKPTGAKYRLAGEMFYAWHVGILRYESRDASGRIHIRDNGSHRSTFSASVDGVHIDKDFRRKDTAAAAAIKIRDTTKG
jgi:hypothetical protein